MTKKVLLPLFVFIHMVLMVSCDTERDNIDRQELAKSLEKEMIEKQEYLVKKYFKSREVMNSIIHEKLEHRRIDVSKTRWSSDDLKSMIANLYLERDITKKDLEILHETLAYHPEPEEDIEEIQTLEYLIEKYFGSRELLNTLVDSTLNHQRNTQAKKRWSQQEMRSLWIQLYNDKGITTKDLEMLLQLLEIR